MSDLEPLGADLAPTPSPIGAGQAAAPGGDKVTSLLLRAVLLLLIVSLVAATSLILYMLSMRGAPRTQAERDVATYETAVKEQPKQVTGWVSLAYAYADIKRYNDALKTIEQGVRQHKTERAFLDTARADVLRLRGDHIQALKAYDFAQKTADSEWKVKKRKEKERQVVFDRPNPLVAQINIGRALSYIELKRPKDALTALEAARKDDPQNSYLLTKIGDVQLSLGRQQDAETSFTKALNYVPDYAPALEGLQRIREGN